MSPNNYRDLRAWAVGYALILVLAGAALLGQACTRKHHSGEHHDRP